MQGKHSTLEIMTNKQVGTLKKVHFSPNNVVVNIPNRFHFTPKEKASMWYDGGDYRKIKQQAARTLRLMERGNNPADDIRHCTLGLKTRHKSRRSRCIRREALHSVLSEQYSQWDNNASDPDALADKYFEITSYNQYQALQRALTLESDVLTSKFMYLGTMSGFTIPKASITLPAMNTTARVA